ncbi:unnamed protein product [Psylliodes chrysocephalus]|uniref:Uncharacterized protein n=1 Tax=Psylliodes chrysocephalus TaxID=3402493 RepID=A0A9P0GB12_9CUCU|nr:unnamed protein product [Psylliodes chrysocephala]
MVTAVAFITLCASIPLKDKSTDQSEEDYSPRLDAPADTYQIFQTPLPLSLELPKVEENPILFYAPEPETFLKAPRESSATYDYISPIPNQDLVAPADTLWNPENNPKFYYEVPTIISKQELPTQEFPKKYNKVVHEKNKPISSKPKQEVIFETIPVKQHEERQIELEKAYEKLAKKENQKLIKMLPPRNKKPSSPSTDSTPISSNQIKNVSYDQGLSSQLIDSLGIPTNAAANVESPGGERLEFHMVGHDGPLSYKWGYDTGKGPNRLFRFEERDKEGQVKGHYGFYDETGKLQVIHYDAHPDTGFHVSENS